MKPYEIPANLGKLVQVTRGADLYMEVSLRPVLNQKATLVKQTRNGPLYVEFNGQHYTIPMVAINALPNNEEETIVMRVSFRDRDGPQVQEKRLCTEKAFMQFLWNEVYGYGSEHEVEVVDGNTVRCRRAKPSRDVPQGGVTIATFTGSDSDMFSLWQIVKLYDFVKSTQFFPPADKFIRNLGRGALYKTPDELVQHCGATLYIGRSLLQGICMGFFKDLSDDDRLWMADVNVEKLAYLVKRHVFFGETLSVLSKY